MDSGTELQLSNKFSKTHPPEFSLVLNPAGTCSQEYMDKFDTCWYLAVIMNLKYS
ncbi:hypothetical protein H6P81_011599 [Aristolochia fimbriata]|uniref:Uncharacterized protein n=1 Tax=Aristolochia fimbriata TaxID=158543 RepID=A0AAV7ESQ6_ARIFI|nr:hypothetical protein H6P81_011599 [Aristolochia fimbriata]